MVLSLRAHPLTLFLGLGLVPVLHATMIGLCWLVLSVVGSHVALPEGEYGVPEVVWSALLLLLLLGVTQVVYLGPIFIAMWHSQWRWAAGGLALGGVLTLLLNLLLFVSQLWL